MPKSAAQYLRYMHQHAPEFLTVRHTIHQNPELGFEEHETSALVSQRLTAWGYEVERGIGGTGVVGRLQRGRGKKRIGIRADMDALPIEEKTGLAYSSRRPGIMHACGHDGHVAMLLGAAKYLAEEGEFSGTLNLIFQPAEEGMGGALRMIDDGLFEKYPCDSVYAMHNMPGRRQGDFVFREGAAMASSDYATVTLTGIGGHGAMPHLCRDPIVAAASIIMALQTIVSRNADPQQAAIVSVGAIHAGKANNVIPQTLTMEISMRALTREMRIHLEQRLKSIVIGQAECFGVRAEIDFRRGYAVLVNTPEETEFARSIGRALVGDAHVEPQGMASTGSEDFAFMLERCPGAYLMIGNGRGDEHGACMVHNQAYDFNDSNLPLGAAYWSMLAETYLT
ncbi:M20 aminoacylase family protein [Variovorax sp. J22R133]|uniref:M20 aminoacylase family protein n=1 Tax=Variovorax brevis TaxID=3053503 RepID=UPI0025781E5A|nr:M20 aminoacylase family protein [Variovorax sp. J22R133]MDM0114634.1 M20 aminoacylase family protein [Variovorax sp. J22R133]